MNSVVMELQSLKPELLENFGITKLALFGSYATGTETEKSDIDILIVEMKRKNGFTIARAQRFLSDHFNKVVDLGLYDSLRPFIKKQVAKDIMYV